MLLVANLANTKWCKKPVKWPKPWQMGTHMKVLGESFPMNTNIMGFNGFRKYLRPCNLDERSLSIRRVKPQNGKGEKKQKRDCCLFWDNYIPYWTVSVLCWLVVRSLHTSNLLAFRHSSRCLNATDETAVKLDGVLLKCQAGYWQPGETKLNPACSRSFHAYTLSPVYTLTKWSMEYVPENFRIFLRKTHGFMRSLSNICKGQHICKYFKNYLLFQEKFSTTVFHTAADNFLQFRP